MENKGCGKEFRITWQVTVPKANLFVCGKSILCPDCENKEVINYE